MRGRYPYGLCGIHNAVGSIGTAVLDAPHPVPDANASTPLPTASTIPVLSEPSAIGNGSGQSPLR